MSIHARPSAPHVSHHPERHAPQRAVRLPALAAGVLLLLATFGVPARAADDYVYAHDAGGDLIHGWLIDQDGVLSPVPGSPFDGPDAATSWSYNHTQSMAYGRLGKQHFLLTADHDGVTVWEIAANGALTAVGGPHHGGLPGSNFIGVTAQRAGKQLLVYATSSTAGKVIGFSLTADGTLSTIPGSPFDCGTEPTGIDSAKGVVVVSMYPEESSAIRSYTIQKDGSLLEAPTSPLAVASSNPYSVTLDPKGKLAFVHSGTSGAAEVLAVDRSTGDLTPVTGSPFEVAPPGARGNGTQQVGKQLLFTFAVEGAKGDPLINVLRRDKQGELSLVGRHASPVPNVTSHAVDPQGRRLVLVSDTDDEDNVFSYRVDPRSGAMIVVDSFQIDVTQVNDVQFVRR